MYYSYTQGNGPFHVWGENPPRIHPMLAQAMRGRDVEPEELVMPDKAQTVYSDRLLQWDSEKHDALCRKHFGNEGQDWHGRTPELIGAFLSDYMGKPVKAVALWQYNNAASGYPIWLIFFRPSPTLDTP